MNPTQGASAILKDSAIVLAIVSGLLYFWGIIGDRVHLNALGIPYTFVPERSVQEYLVNGGLLGLFFVVPVALLFWIIDLGTDRRITRYFADFALGGHFFAVVNYLMVFLAATVLVAVGTLLSELMRKDSFKVKNIRLTDNAKRMGNYEGLYLVTKSAKMYLFVDKFGKGATFYFLDQDEVKELIIHQSQ
jgi:hypothetical protein